MSTTNNASSAQPAALDAVQARRTVAAIADETVETVSDLYVRGRPDEIADELRETHLPALAEAGYIEWDREAGTISPGPSFDEAAAHVADLPAHTLDSADD